MVADINGDAAAAIAQEVGNAAVAHCANVAVSADVESMAQAAFASFGTLDIVVNNAGITLALNQ